VAKAWLRQYESWLQRSFGIGGLVSGRSNEITSVMRQQSCVNAHEAAHLT
jgi:hypothetical protein